ncbi:MAG: hypothetical protein NXI25_18455 [bacterium]|nr:hypothetical protein [bacterium]
MKFNILICLLLATGTLSAQNGLEGLWVGSIIEKSTGEALPVELYLTLEKGYIKGMSYIYVNKDSVITQELVGKMYQDRSIYMREVTNGEYSIDNITPETLEGGKYVRKYQFEFKRSIWESSLNGFWQEVTPTPLSVERKLGQIKLERKKSGDSSRV